MSLYVCVISNSNCFYLFNIIGCTDAIGSLIITVLPPAHPSLDNFVRVFTLTNYKVAKVFRMLLNYYYVLMC